ncbi:hypothetical protein HMI56_007690 [Coelomomyces lativittatus]|nr:hypothetical protein HMI56_007690 [Coelomomyces lativittatus]
MSLKTKSVLLELPLIGTSAQHKLTVVMWQDSSWVKSFKLKLQLNTLLHKLNNLNLLNPLLLSSKQPETLYNSCIIPLEPWNLPVINMLPIVCDRVIVTEVNCLKSPVPPQDCCLDLRSLTSGVPEMNYASNKISTP